MTMKYKFFREGVEEDVKPERWVWGVLYEDGRELHQFGDDGIFHQVGEIEQDKIVMASFYKYEEMADMTKRIDIPWKEGRKLIHKYVRVNMNIGTEGERRVTAYCFGYKDGKHQSVLLVLPDDRIVFNDGDVQLSRFNI